MATMKITLIGMYNIDNTLFDNMILPEDIDRETFINSLLTEAGEFEVLYANPDFMKFNIGTWSRKWQRTFEKWVQGLKAEWNPIENYDRYEEWEDNGNKNGTTHSSGSDRTDVKGKGSNEDKVSAYDSSSYQPKNMSESNSESGSTSTTSADYSNTETSGNKHIGHIHGNIGVTQSSEMLANWFSISEWNIYSHMIDLFKSEMLIPVY